MNPSVDGLTRSSVLARGVVWNLLGSFAPLGIALVALPILVHTLGTDRFGVLSLAWVLIGYFGLFDLGLGRALTQVVARSIGAGQSAEVAPAIWTSLFVMTALGVLGAVGMAAAAPVVVTKVLRIPVSLQGDSILAVYYLAAGIPLVVASAGLRGVMEALQRFDAENVVRIGLGAVTYLGPLLLLPFTRQIWPIVLLLVVARFATLLIYAALCMKWLPQLRAGVRVQTSLVWELVRLGGWISVSNILAPLLTTIDRFFVGGLVSISAVTYYSTPFDVVTRLLLVASAIAAVLYPAFALAFEMDRDRSRRLFIRGSALTFVACFPPILAVVFFAHDALSFWLGRNFAEHSAVVLQVLAFGVLFNGLAAIPFALIQGAGRPDITARLHLIETPIYIIGMTLAIHEFGIVGAAVAWSLRVACDMLVLYALALSILDLKLSSHQPAIASLAGSLVLLAIVSVAPSGQPAVRMIGLIVLLMVFYGVAWPRVVPPSQRAALTIWMSSWLRARR